MQMDRRELMKSIPAIRVASYLFSQEAPIPIYFKEEGTYIGKIERLNKRIKVTIKDFLRSKDIEAFFSKNNEEKSTAFDKNNFYWEGFIKFGDGQLGDNEIDTYFNMDPKTNRYEMRAMGKQILEDKKKKFADILKKYPVGP